MQNYVHICILVQQPKVFIVLSVNSLCVWLIAGRQMLLRMFHQMEKASGRPSGPSSASRALGSRLPVGALGSLTARPSASAFATSSAVQRVRIER